MQFSDTQQLHIIQHRSTQRARVITFHGVKRAVEHYSSAARLCLECKYSPLEAPFALWLIRRLHGVFACKSFHHHGTFTCVVRITDSEWEDVASADCGLHHLCKGTFFSGDEFDGTFPLRNWEVFTVDVLDGFQGFNYPAWKRTVVIFNVRWNQDSPWSIWEDVGAFFEISIL